MTVKANFDKIVQEQLALYDGVNPNVSVQDFTFGRRSGSAIGDFVDVAAVYGNGESFTGSTIQKALNAIGSREVQLNLSPGTWTIDSNLSIPVGVSLYPVDGATINIATGITLANLGDFPVPMRQVFTGVGTFSLSGSRTKIAIPEWWGIDGTADDLEIQKAISSGALRIELAGSSYSCTGEISITTNNLSLVSDNRAELITTNAGNGFEVTANDVHFQGLRLQHNLSPSYGGVNYLIYSHDNEDLSVFNCDLSKISTDGIRLENSTKARILKNKFNGQILSDPSPSNAHAGVRIDSSGKTNVMANEFDQCAQGVITSTAGGPFSVNGDPSDSNSRYNNIVGNEFSRCWDHPFYFSSGFRNQGIANIAFGGGGITSDSDQTKINLNHIESETSVGIHIRSVSYCEVANNYVRIASGNSAACIQVKWNSNTDIQDINIKDNFCRGGIWGVCLRNPDLNTGNLFDVNIENNTCVDQVENGTDTGYAIYTRPSGITSRRRINVMNNRVKNAAGLRSVYLNSIQSGIVSGNSVFQDAPLSSPTPHHAGIHFRQCGDLDIFDNHVDVTQTPLANNIYSYRYETLTGECRVRDNRAFGTMSTDVSNKHFFNETSSRDNVVADVKEINIGDVSTDRSFPFFFDQDCRVLDVSIINAVDLLIDGTDYVALEVFDHDDTGTTPGTSRGSITTFTAGTNIFEMEKIQIVDGVTIRATKGDVWSLNVDVTGSGALTNATIIVRSIRT